jgi:hypothetical protein
MRKACSGDIKKADDDDEYVMICMLLSTCRKRRLILTTPEDWFCGLTVVSDNLFNCGRLMITSVLKLILLQYMRNINKYGQHDSLAIIVNYSQ